jgi:cytochrome c-type biogenesis protein CcmE
MTTVSPSAPAPTRKPRRGVRMRYVVASVLCVGVVAWLLIGGLAKNIVYLRPVSYAVAHRAQEGTSTFRMAGQVLPGSINERTTTGAKFVMTDGTASARVNLLGTPPDLFGDCQPVVVEGKWDGTTFLGDRLLVRHGPNYSASQAELAAQHKAELLNKKCPPGSAG